VRGVVKTGGSMTRVPNAAASQLPPTAWHGSGSASGYRLRAGIGYGGVASIGFVGALDGDECRTAVGSCGM